MTDDDILERLLFGGDGDDVVILSPAIDDLAIAPSSAPTEASSNHSDESDAPKRKRQRTSLKHELEYLREKQEALQAQLNELRATTVVRQPSSIWEMRAKTQIAAATRAMQENASLRTLLQEQLKTAQTLERVLKRSPKLELSPQFNREEWRSWRLDADPAARIQSMLAITDHMYDRLEGELIKSKVYDLHDRQSCMNVRTHQNVLWFDFIQSTIMDVDHDAMRSATWALARQQLQMDGGPILSTTGTILADVPEFNMVYTRNESTMVFTSGSSCKSEGRWIARMYTEPHRTVLVYRTILDDALEPHTPGILRDNLAGCGVRPTRPRPSKWSFTSARRRCRPAATMAHRRHCPRRAN
ncbi:hypothetical protein, variant 1 [Aphanomyces invadans]|uniref:Uncharacterized protein n=1 Tax=Aphanomyces invadans TaxID=157072 RepID=A0A024TFR6_9STRA|nr:hypothetical protein, variant 1 [Aphanomyces invadans]ETV92406.1 hypothetical protein, variant 1 [Aphanomyces invadans]|eukprot:XP_008878958.1 hypothetical protein, variant 1 [Aphanomyces invadans]